MGDVVEVIDRAVDGVDHPGETAGPGVHRALLTVEAVGGAGLAQEATDQGLGLPVGQGHDIYRRRFEVGYRDPLSAPPPHQLTRGHGHLAGDHQQRGGKPRVYGARSVGVSIVGVSIVGVSIVGVSIVGVRVTSVSVMDVGVVGARATGAEAIGTGGGEVSHGPRVLHAGG